MTLTRPQFVVWTLSTALLGALLGALGALHGVPTLRVDHSITARHLLIFTTPSGLRTNTATR